MKKLLIIAFLLINTFALNYSYDGLVYATPNESVLVPIYVRSVSEAGTYRVSCASDTLVRCPNSFLVEAGKEKHFDTTVKAGLGSHKVSVWVGGDFLKFEVIGSNQTEVFLKRLEDYEGAFNKLRSDYGDHPLIDAADGLIREGYRAYGRRDISTLGGINNNLASVLSDYYDTLDPSELFSDEEPARLNFSVIPLLLLVSLVVFLYRKKPKNKKGERTYVKELTSLIEKEEYEVGSR